MATVTRRPAAGSRLSTGAIGWGLLLVLTAIGLTWGIRSNTCPSNLGAWVGFGVTGFRLGCIYAIGVSLFLSNLFLLLDGKKHLGLPFNWPNIGGPAPINYPQPMHRGKVFSIVGVPVANITILVILVAIGMLIVLDLFVRRTRAGKGIRAVAEDPETAS